MNAPRTPMTAQQPPLTGLKVLEFANFFAGPFACMVLADLGADVIKIENPQGGDFSRASAPFIQDEGAGFMAVNRNKCSLSLDLKHPMGREAALALAKSADVVVENFRPGTMQDLGLDYDALKAVNAGIIYCSTSAFGQTGPYGPRAGLDLIVQGMSGLMSITGEPGRPPVKCGAPISDLTGGLYSANAIQAAYIHRLRTGEGQCIDVSLFESAVSLQIWETSLYYATGEVPEPLGSAHRASAPYQALRTEDGYVTMGATTPRTWTALCGVLGVQELENDPRFAANAGRKAREQELAGLLEQVTMTKTSNYWYQQLEEVGVPCGVINTLDQVLSDAHLRDRGFLVQLPHTKIGQVAVTGSPMHLSQTPVRLDWAGPLLGEHNHQVLAEAGYSEQAIAKLEQQGVIGPQPSVPNAIRSG